VVGKDQSHKTFVKIQILSFIGKKIANRELQIANKKNPKSLQT